jgi:hypothetical protein
MIGDMFRAAVVLSLASVLLTALALISCLSVEDKREIRGLPRSAWVVVILLVPLAGAVAWFWLGRPRPGVAGRWPIRGPVEPSRPRAPDDDAEFLRSLGTQPVNRSDDDVLRRLEDDLTGRREEPPGEPEEPRSRKPEERRPREPGADG